LKVGNFIVIVNAIGFKREMLFFSDMKLVFIAYLHSLLNRILYVGLIILKVGNFIVIVNAIGFKREMLFFFSYMKLVFNFELLLNHSDETEKNPYH